MATLCEPLANAMPKVTPFNKISAEKKKELFGIFKNSSYLCTAFKSQSYNEI
jgi:hypothetical protein